MQKYFALIAMIMLYFLNIPIVFAVTEITGTVTAKRDDTLKVEFHTHKTAMPKIGDMVQFSIEILQGTIASAGIGKVIEVDKNFVWVQTSDNRPDLTMNAVIQATGFSQAKVTKKSNRQGPSDPKRGKNLKWRRIEIGKSLTLGGDYFNAGQSTLKLTKIQYFDGIVEQLQGEPDRKIRIVGHTDATGSASVNQKLSEKRAKAVGAILIAQGVASERLTILGLGETLPVATNATQEGRSKNRRVEIIILERKNDTPPLHRCDELAGDPYDSQRIGPTVEHLQISASAAIPACQEALLKYPDNVRFLFQLGRAYAADKQYQTAYSYFKKAADKGHITAQNYIGDLFSQGWGVTKDMTKAYQWYQKAAEQGHVLAQYHLGEMYWNGVVVSQDLAEAVKWFRKSAEQGWVSAQNAMGRAYENGIGVTKNLATAEKWYRKSVSQQEFGWTTYGLGVFLFNKNDGEKSKSEAAKWFRKAAEKGHKEAQGQIGYMYHTGTGVQRDDTLAVKWYRKSADSGYAVAQYNLGIMYYNGDGVTRDTDQAKKWFQKAADQKHEGAIKMLKRLKNEH